MHFVRKFTHWARTEWAEEPSFKDIVRELAQWPKNVWKARKPGTRPSQAAHTTIAAARRNPQAPVEKPIARPPARPQGPDHGPESDEITQGFMRRLAELQADFGVPGSDASALLEDLRTFEPSMIRQPAAAALKVLRLLRGGNYSGAELAGIIESDPAIAQALLRHANSTWYAKSEAPPLASLTAAARLIGGQGVHAAVMSTIMEGGFARPGAGLDGLAKCVWDHMVRVAPMARQLGQGFGADPDAAFTLGLCHDVGKLVLFDRIADLRRRLRRDIRFPRGFLRATLKKLHEPVGGLAALAWGLPAEFASIIATHHRDPPPPRLSRSAKPYSSSSDSISPCRTISALTSRNTGSVVHSPRRSRLAGVWWSKPTERRS